MRMTCFQTVSPILSMPIINCFIEDSTPEFEQFMDILGEKIELQGWKKFRGGLDVKGIFFFFNRFAYLTVVFLKGTLPAHTLTTQNSAQ